MGKPEPYPEFEVTLTLRLSCSVSFPAGANPKPSDAIENAIGRLPEAVFAGFGGEFDSALPIDGEATEV